MISATFLIATDVGIPPPSREAVMQFPLNCKLEGNTYSDLLYEFAGLTNCNAEPNLLISFSFMSMLRVKARPFPNRI